MTRVQPWIATAKEATRYRSALPTVLLEPSADGETTRAIATDGCILVCADHYLPFPVPGRRLVDAASLKAVMTANRSGTVTLDGPDGQALVASKVGMATVRAELQLEDAGMFPQWETLLDGLTPTAGISPLDPYLYVRLAKAIGLEAVPGGARKKPDQTFELISHGPGKPVKMVGSEAWGLIMPLASFAR